MSFRSLLDWILKIRWEHYNIELRKHMNDLVLSKYNCLDICLALCLKIKLLRNLKTPYLHPLTYMWRLRTLIFFLSYHKRIVTWLIFCSFFGWMKKVKERWNLIESSALYSGSLVKCHFFRPFIESRRCQLYDCLF